MDGATSSEGFLVALETYILDNIGLFLSPCLCDNSLSLNNFKRELKMHRFRPQRGASVAFLRDLAPRYEVRFTYSLLYVNGIGA